MAKKLVLSNKITHEVTKDMIGLFFEDINFAADGGLYAEMLENRSFEAVKSTGEMHNYVLEDDFLYAWSPVHGSEKEDLVISGNAPVSEVNPHYLRFHAKKSGCGFANKAYDGISLKKGMSYKVSFFAKEVTYQNGSICVSVEKDGVVYASATLAFTPANDHEIDPRERMVGNVGAKVWKKYETVLTAEEEVKGAAFIISLTEEGTMEFDLISMIPQDAVAGVFRKDILEALAGLHPGFLRFPGGCIVEGTSLMRRYQWKNTVGDLKDRKINTNLWALMGGNTLTGWTMPDCHYMQSYGIGFYEYFLLCELLSSEVRTCRPLPVMNIGVACQFRSYETVPVDSPEFDAYIQDVLDLIEFANGSTDTYWGSLRAKMGHPESFHLDMIAIGNEQWESRHVDLYERYARFEKAIHAVYPDMKLLGTAGPGVKDIFYDDAWKVYHDKCKENPAFTYAVDEHYYVKPEWLYENVDFYDEYSREIGVFAGEYAGHDCNQCNSVEAAIAESAMLTGMERNGDVVKLASYAPLFNRIGHSQWTPDMIWFDADQVVLTPSYFAQKLFSDYAGTQALELNGQEKELRKDGLYISLVKDADQTILKVVNGTEEDQDLELCLENGQILCKEAQIITLKAEGAYQTPVFNPKGASADHPQKAMPVGSISNYDLCMERYPEKCIYTKDTVQINGTVRIPAKSASAFLL